MNLRQTVGILAGLLTTFAVGGSVYADSYERYDKGIGHELIELAAERHDLINRRSLRFLNEDAQRELDRIAAAVVPQVDDEYIDFRVFLLRDPSPASFSFADGQIYIHTGLIARLQTEAQIAAVIAHEAHHVAAHDHFRADRSRRGDAVLLGVAGMAAGIGQFSATVSQSMQTKFSEAMEREADANAARLVRNAGYPAAAALQLLDRILLDPELTSPDVIGSWTTFEDVQERRSALEASLGEEAFIAAPAKAIEFREIVEMTIDDYIRLDRAGTAVEWIDVLIESGPESMLYAAKGDAHVALGPRPHHITAGLEKSEIRKLSKMTRAEIDEYFLQTAEGETRLRNNTDQAIAAYTKAIEIDESNARAHAGLGKLYFELKDYRPAARHLLRYLKLNPDAIDRALIIEKLQHVRDELRNQEETTQ